VQCTDSVVIPAHSYVTVVCVIGWIWEKKLVCLCSLAVCACEISQCQCQCQSWIYIAHKREASIEQGFSTNSHSTTNRLKHLSNFISGENIRSLNFVEFEFKFRYITVGLTSRRWLCLLCRRWWGG